MKWWTVTESSLQCEIRRPFLLPLQSWIPSPTWRSFKRDCCKRAGNVNKSWAFVILTRSKINPLCSSSLFWRTGNGWKRISPKLALSSLSSKATISIFPFLFPDQFLLFVPLVLFDSCLICLSLFLVWKSNRVKLVRFGIAQKGKF